MRTITIDGQTFKHGDRVTGVINTIPFPDGKVNMPEGTAPWYICQNTSAGAGPVDRLGFLYGWCMGSNPETYKSDGLTSIKHYEPQVINAYSIY